MSGQENLIAIKRNFRIGDLEAETDIELLKACFVESDDLSILLDVKRPESIVIGRTGSGKSALLIRIQEVVEKSKFLDPNDISIRFLENSDIIQFFTEIGVNLDLFYRLLWRHILTVELLKLRYSLKSQSDGQGVLSKLTGLVDRDNVKKEALSYFKEWGEKFWLDTDQQLKEVTEKLSKDLKAGFGTDLHGIDLSLEGARSLSSERKTEIVHKANRVVSQIQIKKLADILDLLEEKVFDDHQRKYYLLIDKLDEDWANTETRYRFIRALIEEVKTFRRIKNLKIIIAMRKDLLDIVFDRTRDAGFQQEKYESYLLPIKWTKDDLIRLVELRINEVFRRQYTKKDVRFDDYFPSPKSISGNTKKTGGGQRAIDYILERTLLRPRDIIQFVNECFISAYGSPRVSWRSIATAEANYSNKRLASLFEEWSEIYPCLRESIEILRGVNEKIHKSDIAERMQSVLINLALESADPCSIAVVKFCDPQQKQVSESDLSSEFIHCFYRIGAIGIRISGDTTMWSDFDHAMLSKSEIKRTNQIYIHKMLHRALGVREV